MLSHQNRQSWQQSPVQGAIPARSPLTPADEAYLQEVLTECRVKLESAINLLAFGKFKPTSFL